MTDRIPVKGIITSGAATALGEFEPPDRIPAAYLNLPKGYIDGMRMEWVSGNSLRATSGSAYIPALDRVLELASAVTKAALSLTANTWYHVYLFLNGSTPDIEIVTTAPASPYSGSARTKAGDLSRRYIGSAKSDASGLLMNFIHDIQSGHIKYLYNINVPALNVLPAGTASASANVSASTAVPITGRLMESFMENTTTSNTWLSNPLVGAASTTTLLFYVRSGTVLAGILALDELQRFNYVLAPAPSSGALSVYCVGYFYER